MRQAIESEHREDAEGLPEYQCHKRVRAGKITGMVGASGEDGVELFLDGQPFSLTKDADWMAKHLPAVGGWYVEHEDGYSSYSPGVAFEGGYSRVLEERDPTTAAERTD